MESRLPQALTALLTGAALSACGLLLQTAFRNPLAGPGIFGISSGAGLGVALVMLLLGGSVTTAAFSVSGFLAILLAAFVGAMLITLLLFFFFFDGSQQYTAINHWNHGWICSKFNYLYIEFLCYRRRR